MKRLKQTMNLLPNHVYLVQLIPIYMTMVASCWLDPKSNVSVIQMYINPQLRIVPKQTHNFILFE